jgi:phenylacetate-CoA ligase
LYNYFRIAYDIASLLRHTHWSREQLLDYQNRKVQEIVRYAFENVPFYHEKFLKSGIKPDDVKSVQDLNKLPIIRREELQENSSKLISSEFDQSKLKVVSTSGSSGKPLFTYLTKREDEFRKAKLLRPHIVCGQKFRDKWVVIGPPQHSGKATGIHGFLGIYVPVIVSVFDEVSSQISTIERLRPDVLDGYSSSLFLLAKEMERMDIETIRPRIAMGGAELIDESSRRFLEDVLGAPYYDQYASEELQMIAWQCPEKDGYHIDADSIFMQFVDNNGIEVAPGERGEIVCTSLFNHAMPIIRYALGDVGVPSEQGQCTCGRKFPLMKLMEGRKESVVVLPDGRSLSPLAIGDCMCAFKYFNNVFQYRFIQKKVNSFKVLVKKKDESVDDKIMKTEMLRHVRDTLRLSEAEVDVEIEFTDEIPPDKSGKIRKVVSELE